MTDLDRDDIQGFVLHGYRMSLATYLFYRFDTAAAGRDWLAATLDSITSAADWQDRPPWCANVALTYPGLVALGLPADGLAGFPEAFRSGMAARAAQLGDPESDRSAHWDAEPPFATRGVHALLMVWADEADALDRQLAALAAIAAGAGATLVGTQPLAALDDDGREHFGFRDQVAQPVIAGDRAAAGRGDGEAPIAPGEFLLGHPDELGYTPELWPAELGRNGTFAVYRKLHQDVAAYRAVVGRDDGDRSAAKMMGRWPSGAALTSTDRVDDPGLPVGSAPANDFDHRTDPIGYAIPRGAHARRARPRNGSPVVRRRRLIRRGMPYGPALPPGAPDDHAPRGLVGLFLNADIERQFEFVQRRWLNEPNFDGLSNGSDPIVGPAGRDFTAPRRLLPRRRTGLPQFVSVRGGDYFFVPGMAGLRLLSGGGHDR